MKTSRVNNSLLSVPPRTARISGFTLIEMLVVLVIIGIVVSTVTLSIHTDDRGKKMDTEMRRIEALLKLASQQAVIRNQSLALRVNEHSYSFDRLGQKGWEPITNDQVFRKRKTVDGTELALKVDDLEVKFGKQQEAAGSKKIPPPRIFILSSGEIMPFELILRTDDQSLQYRLKVDQNGKISLIEPQQSG